MIDPSDHYKRVCASIDFFAQRMERTFNLFVQLSIATIGGFVWLKMQSNPEAAAGVFMLARWIIPLLAFVGAVQTISDSISWFGYRGRRRSC